MTASYRIIILEHGTQRNASPSNPTAIAALMSQGLNDKVFAKAKKIREKTIK